MLIKTLNSMAKLYMESQNQRWSQSLG
ncbi:uncharacterized protein METZ01_LOCUS321911 [marine metagenome]|uniref:Uncharacterized protein n=1 Tax=marine metagenome TaxID=408172 RepID=A0A382P8A6_9ZZZZ